MSPDGPTYYIVLFILLALSAFFSMSETAFNSCNIIRMRVKASDGNRAAKLVCKLNDHSSKTLVTILIGNNIVNVFMASMATMVFVFFMSSNQSLATILTTIVTTAVVYVFGEAMPKSLARANADSVAMFCSYFIAALYYILTPVSIIFEGLNWTLSKIFRMKEEPLMTEDDFTNVIESIEEKGILEENESNIIQSAIDFNDTPAKDVLTSRDRIFAIDIANLDHESLKNILNTVNYSRIPVYQGSIDNIIGILHVRTYLKAYMSNKKVSIRATLMKPYFVSNKATVDEIFEGFKKYRTHICIVQNQLGQTMGMVTMDDVLEELVGEMNETHPIKKANPSLKGGNN